MHGLAKQGRAHRPYAPAEPLTSSEAWPASGTHNTPGSCSLADIVHGAASRIVSSRSAITPGSSLSFVPTQGRAGEASITWLTKGRPTVATAQVPVAKACVRPAKERPSDQRGHLPRVPESVASDSAADRAAGGLLDAEGYSYRNAGLGGLVGRTDNRCPTGHPGNLTTTPIWNAICTAEVLWSFGGLSCFSGGEFGRRSVA